MKRSTARKFVIGLSLFSIMDMWGSALRAATLTVTSTNDSGSGSLRQAIQDAAPGNTINFFATGSITLTSGELLITTNLTISGPGSSNLRITRAANAGPFRIFDVSGETVNISGLCISNGVAQGTNAANSGHAGGDGVGGPILNAGALTSAE